MTRRRKTALWFVAALLPGFLSACPAPQDRTPFIPAPGAYDARILRDTWGVPHIFGKRDVDAAYGLAYAHCEDDWVNLEDAVLIAHGRMGAVHGREFAKFDYLLRLFRVREFVDAKYESELSADTRALCEAYASGINHFAALHPGKMPHITLPVTGKDVVAGAVFKAPFFYELHRVLEQLLAAEGGMPIGEKGVMRRAVPGARSCAPLELEWGSNAFAVGPARSADGATRLAINSHQPWTGPVAWYEAHVHSEEGWNMVGGTFPGGPVIFSGHDENKGWCHTVNRPDLVDVYELKVNPDNRNQYWFDGAWRNFRRDKARLTVKIAGPLRITVKRELLWSAHGPAFRTPRGVFAVAFAGYGEVGQVEQWYRMNKARNLDEFLAAMRSVRLTSLNTLYADKDGNIFYAYNGMFPVRAEGHDWTQTLPGDTSALLWQGFHGFEAVPQVFNPPSGLLVTCNSSPFQATDGPGNPDPADFGADQGIETRMTNRALRALETYGTDPSITRDEFCAYKFDTTYSEHSEMARFIAEALAAERPEDTELADAFALLRGWDRTTGKDNRGAALALTAWTEYHRQSRKAAEREDVRACVSLAAARLREHFGRLDVPWGEVLRLRRGTVDAALGGGPDCLRAIDLHAEDDGRFTPTSGDCYVLMAEWGKDGRVRSESVHQFGAATVDPDSPHYADQAPLFAEEGFKPACLTEEQVRACLQAEYRPGEETEPWYGRR